MEKEDGKRSLLLPSSNRGQYGDDNDDDYDDDGAEVLVTSKLSSAAEVIQSGQANVLIVDPPAQESMPRRTL